ncbi:MAG: hypothetical protein AABN34_20200 [Acidobacteriota bacterium]
MRLLVSSKIRITVDHPGVECRQGGSHKNYHRPEGCSVCGYAWVASLPFYRPYQREDELLKVEHGISDEVEWYKKIVRDPWGSEGKEWSGYIVEYFGPKLKEMDTPDDYLFWRIEDEQKPNVIIPLLRTRVCYDPQKKNIPIFLEFRYRGLVTSAIRGMDSDLEIDARQLGDLLHVRSRLLGFDSASASPVRSGRPKGKGLFANEDTFLIALQDVLREADKSLSVANGLQRLSRHQLWQGKLLSLGDCQMRRKTLRNWLGRCNLTWESAKRKYCIPDGQ